MDDDNIQMAGKVLSQMLCNSFIGSFQVYSSVAIVSLETIESATGSPCCTWIHINGPAGVGFSDSLLLGSLSADESKFPTGRQKLVGDLYQILAAGKKITSAAVNDKGDLVVIFEELKLIVSHNSGGLEVGWAVMSGSSEYMG